jgi:pSer/pThr/pTyr-binding forkhead associated (FHA) protein
MLRRTTNVTECVAPTYKLDGHGQASVVGRHESCQIVLDHASVPGLLSRRHAQLQLQSSSVLLVTDLNSTNGTWLRRRRQSAALPAEWERLPAGERRASRASARCTSSIRSRLQQSQAASLSHWPSCCEPAA